METGTAPSITRTTVSVVDTLYTPCGCSPLGKTWKVSLPHAPGGTVYWTEYVYDALGRTIQVKQPNNSGTSTYSYAGNTVTSTDAASKWKKFENDALGNLTKVTEPNPASGANFETTYTYSELAQLLTVSMPRGGVTQTRTFVYNSTTQRLTSTTNPETAPPPITTKWMARSITKSMPMGRSAKGPAAPKRIRIWEISTAAGAPFCASYSKDKLRL